jgi:hypothetical protein
LESDDDDGGGGLSLIEGIVPTDGTLILAVTGYGDESFAGSHTEQGAYELLLIGVPEPGSFAIAALALAWAGVGRRRNFAP